MLAQAAAAQEPVSLPAAPDAGVASPPRRILVLPPASPSGMVAPLAELGAQISARLAQDGVELVGTEPTEAFLERHRVRYTAGVEGPVALAAGKELGALGVLVTSVDQYQATPPKVALSMRLVSADDRRELLWAGSTAASGDDSPGWFDLGVVSDVNVLVAREVAELSAAVHAALTHPGPPVSSCPLEERFRPKVQYRSAAVLDGPPRTVAVLPFANQTGRRGPDELMAAELVRQLHASGRFRVVEPGAVREELLRFRIVTEGGLSLDTARVVLELLQADLVVAGYVRTYSDPLVLEVPPAVEFSVIILDRRDNEVVFQSTSHATGNQGVWFFDRGRINTASELACRMARAAVDALVTDSAPKVQSRGLQERR